MNLTSVHEWNGLVKGAPVKVRGLRGDYTFRSFTTNEETGEAWVAVYGGTGGPHGFNQFRYIDPSRVKGKRT